MERLELNLLEFILENPLRRLPEDVTKFISYQVEIINLIFKISILNVYFEGFYRIKFSA